MNVSIEDIEVARCIKCNRVSLLIVTENDIICRNVCKCHDPVYESIDFGYTAVVWDEETITE